eukprot:1612230-Pyramimonas_sp.AAC.1
MRGMIRAQGNWSCTTSGARAQGMSQDAQKVCPARYFSETARLVLHIVNPAMFWLTIGRASLLN